MKQLQRILTRKSSRFLKCNGTSKSVPFFVCWIRRQSIRDRFVRLSENQLKLPGITRILNATGSFPNTMTGCNFVRHREVSSLAHLDLHNYAHLIMWQSMGGMLTLYGNGHSSLIPLVLSLFPTSPFTILDPQNPWIDEFYIVVQERRGTDCKAPKLWQARRVELPSYLTGYFTTYNKMREKDEFYSGWKCRSTDFEAIHLGIGRPGKKKLKKITFVGVQRSGGNLLLKYFYFRWEYVVLPESWFQRKIHLAFERDVRVSKNVAALHRSILTATGNG